MIILQNIVTAYYQHIWSSCCDGILKKIIKINLLAVLDQVVGNMNKFNQRKWSGREVELKRSCIESDIHPRQF